MHRMRISIETLSPVVLTAASNSTIMTGTHAAFSGSIIRGVLASRYVEAQKLGDAAYRDETFREIFYGGLSFVGANPEVSGRRAIVLPLSLQKAKAGTANENAVEDLLTVENPSRGYKSLRGYGVVAGDKIQPARIGKNIFMHMSRSGEAERLAGKSLDGQIYNYEALDAGQKFQGEIIGGAEILRKLVAGLKAGGEFTAYVGRSKFTQYGKCRFRISAAKEIVVPDFGEKIYLRLDAPLISAEDNFLNAAEILQTEVVDELGGKFKLGRIFSANVEVENFVVPWAMKRARMMALAAGTVFELTAENLTSDDKKNLGEKIYRGFGVRTEEGFGQIRLWDSRGFTLEKTAAEEIQTPVKFSGETVELAKKILLNKVLAQVRVEAIEDAQDLRRQLKRGNFTHFFSRLDGILANAGRENVREKFQERLAAEIRTGTLFDDHLKNIRMTNGQSFFDAFSGHAELPYESRDLEKNFAAVKEALGIAALNFDDEIYFEYLQKYFRFARKVAAEAKGGEDE